MIPGSGPARRFAEAAYEIAVRDGSQDVWVADLATASQFAASGDFLRIVDSPAIPFAERRRIVEETLGPRIARPALNLVLLLVQRGRLGALPAVAAQFTSLLNRERGIVAATVTSAVPLEPDELAAVQTRLESTTGAHVDLTTALDPELIGGLTVRVGDRLIDASVRGRLERLREQLTMGAR